MKVSIERHPLDRVSLSLIIDDSTALVNLNYFFLRQCEEYLGKRQRWEDIPVVHPESFTREFGEWCAETGVKGKFSIVPCPAGIGRIDQGLPMVSPAQLDSWLAMCRETIVPSFDITPEMMTHTFVVDLETFQPVDPTLWEQWGWDQLPVEDEDLIVRYIETACRILDNVGLTPAGVTSPGGFGNPLDVFSRCAQEALRRVTPNPVPYLFKRISRERVETPVWFPDVDAGTALGEAIACTGDWTGSWTGYGDVDADRYISADLNGGRLPEVIDAGDPAILISHWQGFYGMHNEDRRGFHTLKTVADRLRQRDPYGEHTRWRKCSDITRYACAREMAAVEAADGRIIVDAPVSVDDLTLGISDCDVAGIEVDGVPLRPVCRRADFASGTLWKDGGRTLAAFDVAQRQHVLTVFS